MFWFSSSSQNILVSLTELNESEIRSSSSGVNKLEYTGYSLKEILVELTDIPPTLINIKSDKLKNKAYTLKITGDLTNYSDQVILSLFIELDNMYGLDSRLFKVLKPVKIVVIDSADIDSCDPQGGVARYIKTYNRTWKANCVSLEDLIDKLHEWYGYYFLLSGNSDQLYNFELHHDEWDVMKKELNFYYGLAIENDTRELSTIIIE